MAGQRPSQCSGDAAAVRVAVRLRGAVERGDEEEVAAAFAAARDVVRSLAPGSGAQAAPIVDAAGKAVERVSQMSGAVVIGSLNCLAEAAAHGCGEVEIHPILRCCVSRWADARIGVRSSATAAIHAIGSQMDSGNTTGGQLKALSSVVPEVGMHTNWHVKEEGCNYITHVLLCAQRDGCAAEVPLSLIFPLLSSALKDPKPRVEFAAVEACAVLHGLFGKVIIQWVQGFKDEGRGDVLELLLERFAEEGLPRLRSRGKVEHPMLSQSQMPPPPPGVEPIRKVNQVPPVADRRLSTRSGVVSPLVGVQAAPDRPKSASSDDSSHSDSRTYSALALQDIVPAAQGGAPSTAATARAILEQQRRQSTADPNAFHARDMHRPGVTDEEKIRLWLPQSADPKAQELRYKPSTAGTAELELVSISSAASSSTRGTLQSAHAAAETRRRRPEPAPLTHEALSSVQTPPAGHPANNGAHSTSSNPAVYCPPSTAGHPSTAGTHLGDSPSFLSNSTDSQDKLSLLRAKGRQGGSALGGRGRRWLQSGDSTATSADSARGSLATPNVFPQGAESATPNASSHNGSAEPTLRERRRPSDENPTPRPLVGLGSVTECTRRAEPEGVQRLPPSNFGLGVQDEGVVGRGEQSRTQNLRFGRPNGTTEVQTPLAVGARASWKTDRRGLRRPPASSEPRVPETVDLSLTVTSQSSGGRTVSPNTGKYRSVADQARKPQEEIPTEELEPLQHPERVLPDALEGAKGQDWRIHFEALANIRAIAVYSPQVIQSNLQQVGTSLVKSVNNLRSAISKHGIVAIIDLVTHLQRRVDPFLGEPVGIVTSLVRKAAEPNHFLAEEAERALLAVVAQCSPHRVVSALVPLLGHKSEKYRAKAGKILHALICRLGSTLYEMRDAGVVLQHLHRLLGDSNFEVRHWSRLACSVLHQSSPSEFERQCARAGLHQKQVQALTDAAARARAHDEAVAASGARDHLTRVNLMPSDMMPHVMPRTQAARGTLRQRGKSNASEALINPNLALNLTPVLPSLDVEESPTPSEQPRSLGSSSFGRRTSQSLPVSLEPLTAITSDLNDLDWKVRMEGLGRLRELVADHKGEAGQERASMLLTDALILRCSDQNQKVCALALAVLAEVLPVLCPTQMVPPHLSRLVGTITGTLASKTQAVVGEAQRVLTLLQELVDVPTYTQQLCVVLANSANPSVKVQLLGRVFTLLDAAHASRPEVVTKHVLPPCLRLLSDPRSDVRQENNRVMVKCHKLLGERIHDFTSGLAPAQAQRLQDLLED
eukprot:Hpha_TRINITY_DN11501_c0_g1::TRINITY_DN11501_c0_g1_i1::g.32456::m.32456